MFEAKMCDKCGKMFIPTPLHLYKIVTREKTYYYCSYHCYRKAGGDSGK